MTKQDKVNKLVENGLIKLGASKVPDIFPTYSLQTKYGKLTVSMPISKRICRGNNATLAVYSRFEDEKLAHTYINNVNPYSGKWNWVVFSGDYSAEDFASIILNDVEKARIN